MRRQAWTREQLVKALSLYCQLPFGKMHATNPAVIELANSIGRTPSAVSLKLVNFASLDPVQRDREISGMRNSSKADREIWNEYYGKWDVLAEAVAVSESDPAERSTQAEESMFLTTPNGDTSYIAEAAHRRGQAFFRATVLAAHDSKCCITGISSAPLLRASHIVPWSKDPVLRLDPRNGLCLNALHDAAFDRGLIALTEKHELLVSKQLKNEIPTKIYTEMFGRREGIAIKLSERFMPTSEMLDYQRSNVFVA